MATTKVTTGGITDATIATADIADQAVTLAKLEHGTSSNNGKFLRANNGADPTFETVTGTTINNNADNRVITGSGTANTLNAESNVIVDGSGNVGIGTTAPVEKLGVDGGIRLVTANGETNRITSLPSGAYSVGVSGGAAIGFTRTADGAGGSDQIIFETHHQGTSHGERMRIDKDGNVGIGTTSPQSGGLTVENSSEARVQVRAGSNGSNGIIALRADGGNTQLGTWSNHDLKIVRNSSIKASITSDGLCFNSDTAAANALHDYEEGTWTPAFSGLSNTPVLSASGKYVKVGSIVYASAYMQATGTLPTFTTVGDPLIITGIPFTANGTGYTNAHGVLSWSQMDPWGSTYNETPHGDTTGHILVGLESGTNTVFYVSGANNTQRGRVKNNALHNSGYILEWSITYQTNS